MNTDDFIMYKDGKGNISSGGFKVKSILANQNLPVIYKGGNKKTQYFFDNIDKFSVPLPLALLKYKYDDGDFNIQRGGNIIDRFDTKDGKLSITPSITKDEDSQIQSKIDINRAIEDGQIDLGFTQDTTDNSLTTDFNIIKDGNVLSVYKKPKKLTVLTRQRK